MIALMYFVVILPQKKRENQHKNMINALKVGDEIITIGGIKGIISTLSDGLCEIETSFDHTKIRIETWGIKEVIVSETNKNNVKAPKNQGASVKE